MKIVCCQLSLCLSVCHVRTVRLVNELSSLNVATQGNEKIRILLERQKEQILADCRAEIHKHEFQADFDRRSIPKLNGVIEYEELLHEQLLEQNRELREAHLKSLNEMEELKKFQGSTFDTIARRRLVEDQDAILELTAKIQELQNEVNCMNDSRDFLGC